LKLCQALSEVSASQRRSAITGLTEGLRQELILLREAQKSQLSGVASSGVQKSSLSAGVRNSKRRIQSQKKSSINEVKATEPSHRERQGNIWSVRTASGCYYRVRLMVNGFAVASGRIYSQDAAEAILEDIRHAAKASAAEGAGTEAILRAVAAARPPGLELSFQAVLDARGSVGRRMHTQAVRTVDEVITLRQEVCAVEAKGLAAILQWSQQARHSRGRIRRLSEVEAGSLLESIQRRQLHAETRKKHQAKLSTLSSERRQARELRRCQRVEARLRSLVCRAEAALQAASVSVSRRRRVPCMEGISGAQERQPSFELRLARSMSGWSLC